MTISQWKTASIRKGRRANLAGTILVHKILGDAARAGKSLTEIKALQLISWVKSNSTQLAWLWAEQPFRKSASLVSVWLMIEIEFGISIHGEPGYRERCKAV